MRCEGVYHHELPTLQVKGERERLPYVSLKDLSGSATKRPYAPPHPLVRHLTKSVVLDPRLRGTRNNWPTVTSLIPQRPI